MIIDYAAIGLRIRKLRRQKYWTQEKLAEKAEIAPDYLCRIESGKKHPSLTTILLIAGALDTTVDDLLADVLRKDTSTMAKEEKSADNRKESIYNLTSKELMVLNLLAEGNSNLEIAKKLNISVNTTKVHVCSILQKLSVDDRTQAAVKALKENITG